MATVGKVVQLWKEWEIQGLVLFSFVLQVLLFYTGGLRQRSINKFLRFCIWAAYLGADAVAVYTLGFLSRKDAPREEDASGGIPPLSMIWVPFLLVHLGGPDNITAFAIEDNNLWVRHLVSLGLQVILAVYVILKSAGWRDINLLVPCIFVFVAGIIRYGERTMALKYGNLKKLKGNRENLRRNQISLTGTADGGFEVFRTALRSMQGVYHFFAGRSIKMMVRLDAQLFEMPTVIDSSLMERLEIELGMVYDDLYTKATILQTRKGVVFRCTAMVSTIVAFLLFLTTNKQRYGKASVMITNTLFLGGICMDIWSLYMILLSPWTWFLLNTHRRFHWLAEVSKHLLSSRPGLSKKGKLWSNSIGQYDLASALGFDSNARPTLWKLRVMRMIRWTMRFVRAEDGPAIFWFSKFLGARNIMMDKEIIECLSNEVQHFSTSRHELFCFPNTSRMLQGINGDLSKGISTAILKLYVFTELHLNKYPANPAPLDAYGAKVAEVCRKLSRYVLYIRMTYQEMFANDYIIEGFLESSLSRILDQDCGDTWSLEKLSGWIRYEPQLSVETLEEIQRMWIRIIMYIAGKSRLEMHAAQLARGGELLTFLWLLMLHKGLGDSGVNRLELSPPRNASQDNVRYAIIPQVPPV